jgi:hypothetical protein
MILPVIGIAGRHGGLVRGGSAEATWPSEMALRRAILPLPPRLSAKKPVYFGNKSRTTVKKPAFFARKSWSDPIRIV